MSLDQRRWICTECDRVSLGSETLIAPNPFDCNREIIGCPLCYAVDTLVGACHSDGCGSQAGIGEPWPDGVYRWSCHLHSATADTARRVGE